MGTQAQKGWVWTQAEKQWIKTWERDVQTHYKRITEQVDRFQSTLPALADEAAKTAEPFLTRAEGLLAFAHGAMRRNYQLLSPDEAKQRLSDIHTHLAAWSVFTDRPDVQAAIRDANRYIQAQKRSLQKQRREALAQIDQQLKSAEFAQTVDGYVTQMFEATEQLAAQAQHFPLTEPFATAEDRPILQRLLVVHFIRSFYQFNPRVHGAIEPFVRKQPTPGLAEVVRHTYAVVIRDHWDYVLRLVATSGVVGPHMSIEEIFMAHLASIFHSLMLSMEEWQKQRLSLCSLSTDYFTILGVDYTLKAHPQVCLSDPPAISPEVANKVVNNLFENRRCEDQAATF